MDYAVSKSFIKAKFVEMPAIALSLSLSLWLSYFLFFFLLLLLLLLFVLIYIAYADAGKRWSIVQHLQRVR